MTVNPVVSLTGSSLERTARVSADGASLVFSSQRALSGAPNEAEGCRVSLGAGKESHECAEFFRYAAAGETLDCISCDPTGASPLGPVSIGSAYIDVEDYPEVYASPVMRRNLSADGERFFFQTPDPLAAADVNARSGCPFGGPVNRGRQDLRGRL